MATIYMSNVSSELTEDEKNELAAAEKMPIIFDEDCPEMTEDMLKQFHRMDSVVLKISPANMEKVKSFGKDANKILNNLLNLALNDNDLIKKSI
ncbi:MAG: hypothetical protein J6C00_03715 [Eubacterium sp.]|nr:hypothetical protein [Eubacterium sp.]